MKASLNIRNSFSYLNNDLSVSMSFIKYFEIFILIRGPLAYGHLKVTKFKLDDHKY